jgi:hypothetical protein
MLTSASLDIFLKSVISKVHLFSVTLSKPKSNDPSSNRIHLDFCFYLPHMEYEGSIGFVSRFFFIIADFHVLGLFMTKKHDLSEKKFPLSRAVAVEVERKICATPTA